jgi:hypothetical protein
MKDIEVWKIFFNEVWEAPEGSREERILLRYAEPLNMSMDSLRHLRLSLSSMFVWTDTTKGHTHWRGVKTTLEKNPEVFERKLNLIKKSLRALENIL